MATGTGPSLADIRAARELLAGVARETPRPPALLSEAQMSGDHEPLDLVRPLSDLQDLLIAVEP